MNSALDLDRACRTWLRIFDRKIDETLREIDRCIKKDLPFGEHQRRLENIEELRAIFERNFSAQRESRSTSVAGRSYADS